MTDMTDSINKNELAKEMKELEDNIAKGLTKHQALAQPKDSKKDK